jgi:hypothetical protein
LSLPTSQVLSSFVPDGGKDSLTTIDHSTLK